jgi:subtilisin family serine protease
MAAKQRKRGADSSGPPTAIAPIALTPVVRSATEREQFGASGQGIIWAVIDSGVNARHPHFQRHRNLELEPPLRHRDFTDTTLDDSASEMEALVDVNGHGTHAAGIIGGELDDSSGMPATVEIWSRDADARTLVHGTIAAVTGAAPLCKMVSLKVLGDTGEGRLSSAIQAIDWIRRLNADAGRLIVHGATVGVAFDYDPEMFACGQSPICVAVNELVKSGVVVVTPAGNTGYGTRHTEVGPMQGAFPMSIGDPGNAEGVITVGSTHGADPRGYGISYFSSKGPTADGRLKPDLVAPGERVISCGPAGKVGVSPEPRAPRYMEMTGTSPATAAVSGAIAALLSVRRELIGQPLAVKELLLSTADDLKRDRYMQGHGLLNLTRALKESGRAPVKVAESAVADAVPAAAPPEGVPASHPSLPSAAGGVRATAVPAGGKRFVVALSYPGERREYVKDVVFALRDLEIPRDRIFYDRYHQAELAVPNLDTRLQRIYRDESELIVIFISAEYERKDWCGLEWRAIRDIIKRRDDADVMPLRFDDTEVPGLFSIDGYIDLRKNDPERVADLIVKRLGLNRRAG